MSPGHIKGINGLKDRETHFPGYGNQEGYKYVPVSKDIFSVYIIL